MTVEQVLLRRGRYADSVTLMQISREVSGVDGVRAALVAMATELNVDVLTGMGFELPPESDSPNDLLIAVRADEQAMLDEAAELAERLLQAPRPATTADGSEPPPRTVSAAARRSGTGLALISVPGQHAFTEAMDALESGNDVLLFSDNVELWQEIALKDAATERGLLVMGPDCGTAVVAGVGLGFSHTLDRGPVGLVAASGTGAQQVLCLLDAAGVGVSAALGVGGRDLSAAVGGRSSRAALALLDEDPSTELIVLVSKPPAASVAAELRALAGQLATPVEFALLGEDGTDLTAATEAALGRLGARVPSWPADLGAASSARPGGLLRGLFSGGTLCDEAMVIASRRLGVVRSNIPLRPEWAVEPGADTAEHTMIDFGDDLLTRGRAHPMIDPTLRNSHFRAALADVRTGVVLLDVVLGHGSHPDPAAELLEPTEASSVPVVVSLIGAGRDPQGLATTRARLVAAGAAVFASNAQAARHAVGLIENGAAR